MSARISPTRLESAVQNLATTLRRLRNVRGLMAHAEGEALTRYAHSAHTLAWTLELDAQLVVEAAAEERVPEVRL